MKYVFLILPAVFFVNISLSIGDGELKTRRNCFITKKYVAQADVEFWWWGNGSWGIVASDTDKDCNSAYAYSSWSTPSYAGPDGNILDTDLYCYSRAYNNSTYSYITGYSNTPYLRYGKDLYQSSKNREVSYKYNFSELAETDKKNYISNSISLKHPIINENHIILEEIKAKLTLAGVRQKLINVAQIVIWVKNDMKNDDEKITDEKILWEWKAVLDYNSFKSYGKFKKENYLIRENSDSINVSLDVENTLIKIPENIDINNIEITTFVDGKSEKILNISDNSHYDDKNLSLSPNPASDFLEVKYRSAPNEEKIIIDIVDINNLNYTILSKQEYKISKDNKYIITNLPYQNGLYLVKIHTQYGILTRKLKISR